MLNRDQIAERLAAKLPGTERRVATGREREALETAQKLGEWLEIVTPPMPTTLEKQQVWGIAMLGVRAWLRGEGE